MTRQTPNLRGAARVVGCLLFLLLAVACCGLGALVGAITAL